MMIVGISAMNTLIALKDHHIPTLALLLQQARKPKAKEIER
jgi:hypothetical protein